MMKFTYGQVSNNGFVSAIQRLSAAQLPVKTAYTLKRVIDKLESKKKDIGKEWIALLGLHAEVENGVAKLGDDGKFIFKTPESEAALTKAEEAFSATEFTLDIAPMHHSQLDGMRFSARDISTLECLVQFEDTVCEDGSNVLPFMAAKKQAPSQSPAPTVS